MKSMVSFHFATRSPWLPADCFGRPIAAASGVRASQSPRASGLAMEEPALAENESNKFLGYARKQAASLPAGQPLYFSNIVPEKTTAPAVAAQALYHLLGLAMKGAVKVEQPIAFGEVRDLP